MQRASVTSQGLACLVLTSAVFLIGCENREQSSPDEEPVDSAAAVAAVNEIWRDYSATLEAGDLEGWLALWTEDGVQMPPGEPPVVGKDQIRARNQAALDAYDFEMSITNREVRVADDWAYSRGVYEATLTPRAGGDPVPIDGKFMTILRRQPDGSWRIHRDIFNSNVGGEG